MSRNLSTYVYCSTSCPTTNWSSGVTEISPASLTNSWIVYLMNSSNESICCPTNPFSQKYWSITTHASSCVISSSSNPAASCSPGMPYRPSSAGPSSNSASIVCLCACAWIDLHGWLAKAASSVGFERLLFATSGGCYRVRGPDDRGLGHTHNLAAERVVAAFISQGLAEPF